MNDTEQFIQDTKRQWKAADKLELMASLMKYLAEATTARNAAQESYTRAHELLGKEVVENGKLQSQIRELIHQRDQLLAQLKETKMLLGHKNETADTFMRQVQKLQDENAALLMLCKDNGITVNPITVAESANQR